MKLCFSMRFLLFWEVCLRLSCALAFWWLTLASTRARALSFHPVATRDVVKNELDAYFTHDHTISHTQIFDGCLKCLPFHESHRQEWRIDKTIIIESLRIVSIFEVTVPGWSMPWPYPLYQLLAQETSGWPWTAAPQWPLLGWKYCEIVWNQSCRSIM